MSAYMCTNLLASWVMNGCVAFVQSQSTHCSAFCTEANALGWQVECFDVFSFKLPTDLWNRTNKLGTYSRILGCSAAQASNSRQAGYSWRGSMVRVWAHKVSTHLCPTWRSGLAAKLFSYPCPGTPCLPRILGSKGLAVPQQVPSLHMSYGTFCNTSAGGTLVPPALRGTGLNP